jgi:hypothetical protein
MDSTVEISTLQLSWILGKRYLRVDPIVAENIALDSYDNVSVNKLFEVGKRCNLTDVYNWIEQHPEVKQALERDPASAEQHRGTCNMM